MIQMASRVASDLPAGSNKNFSFIADRNINVKTLDTVALDVSNTYSDKITASAIETGISDAFPIGRFKMNAEIVYLLLSDSTSVDIPPILLRKKTFVIVFGVSIPSSLRRVASSNSHIHLVRNDDEIASVAERIRDQTCLDSRYVCDVDMYKENRRYSSCKDCYNVCSQRKIRDTGCPRCPYMRLQPKVLEVISAPGKDEHVPVTYIKDNKNSVAMAIVLSLVTVCAVNGALTVYICHRRQVACFGQHPGNRIPEGVAVVEVGQEDQHAAANANDIPLLPVDPLQPQLEHEDGHAVGRQGYVNLRHSHSGCGAEETYL
ncbi:uncharacterized protein LOC123548461 isoform X2 [Mercenaria mercenaria]|nr:uncharacterized protein LOC123548461 isoform X2 [Mercenaria mercenaria]XP_053401669.1 uncharacterized protein LOC123548461 isoform X2 [Mercenaria mercenaria]